MFFQTAVMFTAVISIVCASSQKEIVRINSVQKYWKAGHNKITQMLQTNGNNYKRLLGAIITKKEKKYRTNTVLNQDNVDIPESFDAREKWLHCVSISAIKDQGNCGSCWAIAVASAASDRLCIHTHGKIQVNISVEQIMTCCESCVQLQGGCHGGDPLSAWEYLQYNGVVTGGDYGSNEGCQPYEIPPNESSSDFPIQSCRQHCTDGHYKKTFTNDKHYGEYAYDVPNGCRNMQNEIFNYGPVEATFKIFEDFLYYTKGVYVRTTYKWLGSHSVRVLGWGHENGVDYWLVANSWGKDWGENGTFKIRRGTNECNFESSVTAGLVVK